MERGNESASETADVLRPTLMLRDRELTDLEHRVAGVYEEFRTPVYLYLAAAFGDPVEAEDITQETFLRLFLHWSAGKSIAADSMRSWIFRVAHNLAIDRARGAKFLRELDSAAYLPASLQLADKSPTPEQTVIDRERFAAVRNGLALLSKQERHCLYLRAEAFSYREIAEILGITVSSVAEFLRRAIRKMTR